ncbi:integrase, catalytic region, zinc finger, CCHC-type containing protein [Tanacetum coccineum]
MALLAQSFRATLPQTPEIKQPFKMVGLSFRMFKGDRIRIKIRGQGKPIKCYNCNGIGHIAWNCTHPKRPQNSDYFKDKMLLMQAQENGAVLDEEELLFLAGEQANTFDVDVDNQPVHILENAIDHSVTNQDEHEIHNEVQQANVIDSTSVDMGNSNVIPYDQYLLVDNISAVPSCASSAQNDACVLSDNDLCIPYDPIATELKIYKEQVAIYEQRAKFELTEREQRMDDQMLQLNSTMENNKIFEETVTTLKYEFKQKESKFLTDFFNLKHLNDKLENKLHSQDQSIQTVHMIDTSCITCGGPKGLKRAPPRCPRNPFPSTRPKVPNPTLYDGKNFLRTHHVRYMFPSSEEELELAETTRNKLHANTDSACVEKRVNITPPNYSKENFMATFTPQTQLTPEQDFEKTCKKRITPTGITEGERGFEQTKRCYLTEVIPFFNLLKEHFDGVQKSLVTEVRAMKAVFENLEAEVDQNEIDLKSGEIEQKNLLITNENLIAECLSKDVFYTATDSVLNVSRFSDMHDAFTIAQNLNGASSASRSKPRSNTKKDRTFPAKSALKQVEAHSRMNKSNEKQKNRVDSSISSDPNVVRTLSGVVTNDMYQPWRALATIINLCLTGKTSGFERPRAPVLQILWGVVNEANIDYAERI